jgi:hypothetical protein
MTEIVIYPGKYYVYEWLSESGECLWIGKGTGQRAWRWDTQSRGDKCLIGLVNATGPIRVKILVIVQTSQEALHYESKLILSCKPKWNTQSRGMDINRRGIVDLGIEPLVIDGFWDRRSCIGQDGKGRVVPEVLRKEVERMLLEGYWGDGIEIIEAPPGAIIRFDGTRRGSYRRTRSQVIA